MTSITCRNTGLPLTGFRRFLSLKRTRGSLHASYSVLRKVLQIPLLRHCIEKFFPDTAWSYDGRGPKLGAWGSLMATFPAMLEKRKIHGLTALVECNNWQAFDAHRSLRFEATALRASLSLFGWHRCYYYKSKGAFWCTIPTTVSGVELCR